MIDKIITEYLLKQIKNSHIQKPHALIIQAQSPVARAESVRIVQNYLIDNKPTENQNNFDLRQISAIDSDSIKIAQIRGLLTWLSLKKTNRIKQQLVIINEGQCLTLDAQNVLLRILEEPPENTHIVISVSKFDNLLKTVISRCQLLVVPPVDEEYFVKILCSVDNNISSNKATKYFYLYQGDLIGALSNIKNNTFDYDETLDQAKNIFQSPLGESILLSNNIKDRKSAHQLINDLMKLSYIGLKHAKNETHQLSWAQKIEFTLDSHRLIDKNINLKLVIDQLILNLRI